MAVIEKGKNGEVYNFGGHSEYANKDTICFILEKLKKSENLIKTVQDRLGHDFRYAISTKKVERELNWKPCISFQEGLKKTIEWYLKNDTWWKEIKKGDYATYYDRQYGEKI
jgi:dTDP-glucose 4,6-dehydratase